MITVAWPTTNRIGSCQSVEVEIAEPAGERWELALDLIRSGESEVICEAVSLWRDTSGPPATGRIMISILSRHAVEIADELQVNEVEAGRRVVERLITADDRLQSLFDEFGVTWAYVADYGSGRVLITDLPPA